MTKAYSEDGEAVASIQRCRQLRRDSTDAERLLWSLLRNRQLAGVKFRRQHRCGPYVVDFYCLEYSLAVEVDGAQHMSEKVASLDAVRTQYLEAKGIRVLRFTNLEVLSESESVVEAIWQALGRPSP